MMQRRTRAPMPLPALPITSATLRSPVSSAVRLPMSEPIRTGISIDIEPWTPLAMALERLAPTINSTIKRFISFNRREWRYISASNRPRILVLRSSSVGVLCVDRGVALRVKSNDCAPFLVASGTFRSRGRVHLALAYRGFARVGFAQGAVAGDAVDGASVVGACTAHHLMSRSYANEVEGR